MDSKGKSQRKVLAAKVDAVFKAKTEKRAPPKKDGKAAERERMPELIAGREVLGRKLSVIKTSKKDAVWVKGAVNDFDEPTIRHKIKYDLPLPEVLREDEEWLCLSQNSFMWRDDDFVCPFANPTYSSKHTPKGEEAINQKVKVFWTAMSTWYQGKVTDYDKVTGKHKVRFHDGEKTEYDFQHEALVWLDIPQLSSEVALRKMRSDEGEPIAIIRNDENQAPVESIPNGNGVEKAPSAVKPALGKKKQAKATDKAATVEGPKTRRVLAQAKAVPKVKEAKAKVATASPRKKAKALPAEINGKASPDVKKKALDDSKAAAKKAPAVAEVTEQKSLAKDLATPQTQKISITANGNGKAAGKASPKSQAAPKAQSKLSAEEASRKRSRLGDPALTSSGSGSVLPEAKRRAVVKPSLVKPASAPAKPGRKPKGEESRLGAKRQKKEADLKFEECCQAVLGARVGVWWEDDHCYYKGRIMAHDWYRKKLKICYDDGVEEYIQPQKEETHFTWLTPRAATAGASSAVHAAFQYLGASNAGLPVCSGETDGVESSAQNTSLPGGQSGVPANVVHAADGSHLDALVPKRANGPPGGKGDAQQKAIVPGETASHSPYPVDSTTRAVSSEGKPPSSFLSAAITSAQQLNLPASTAGLFLGLQSMLGPNSSRSLSFAQQLSCKVPPTMLESQQPAVKAGGQPTGVTPAGPRPASAVSRSGATAETAAASHSSPPSVQGAAAEGWKISITFRGDHKQYSGRVLAYKAETKRHLVLWEDGEDEWVDISEEQLTWHSDRGKSTGFSTGLTEGEDRPGGDKLKGWTLAVFWKHECKFFDGVVVDYDGDLDQHTIHYSDGEERCESVHNLVFKYVLPPNVQPVGARRIHAPRRWQDSGSEPEDSIGYRRQRRRLRAASVDEDTDEEWMGAKAAVERRTGKPPHTVPPIRHLSLGNQRQHSLLQQYGSSPTVMTPGGSEIRRMSSKCGSLLFFEGEDNPAISPATSPKTSPPQISPSSRQDSDPALCKMPSAIDRKVTGLKSALGFRVGVKRVRLYLKGWHPDGPKNGATAVAGNGVRVKEEKHQNPTSQVAAIKQEPAEVQELVPNSQLLKLMMERVEAASLSMQMGTPVTMSSAASEAAESAKQASAGLSAQGSLPSKTIFSTKSAAAGLSAVPGADKASDLGGKDASVGRSQSVPPSIISQPEQHVTPPPSPFANCYHCSDKESDGGEARDTPQLELPGSLPGNGIYSILDKLRGATQGETLASPSHSPDTPSVMGEKQIMALSRNSSVMSDPLLAELLHCKLLSCKGQASLEEQLGLFQSK